MLKYIIRLDDACPTMDWKKWNTIFNILDRFNIKPIVAVIPDNEDESMFIDSYNKNFWSEVKYWESKGYHIAMHGFNHKYISNFSGIIPMNDKSEFAGVNLNIQRDKIQRGWHIFKKYGITPRIWVAPSHTFDKNTLKILKDETDIKIISDGIALYPYNKDGFFWIPQQLWWYSKKKDGIWTICLHPNNMSFEQIEELETIINSHHNEFLIDIETLYDRYKNRSLSLYDKVFFKLFFLKRWLYKSKLYIMLRN